MATLQQVLINGVTLYVADVGVLTVTRLPYRLLVIENEHEDGAKGTWHAEVTHNDEVVWVSKDYWDAQAAVTAAISRGWWER